MRSPKIFVYLVIIFLLILSIQFAAQSDFGVIWVLGVAVLLIVGFMIFKRKSGV